MFEVPEFSFWPVCFTAIGAAVFWGKMGRSKLKAYYLSDLINLLPLSEKKRQFIEIVVFISLGTLVGIGIVRPTTVPQALTAGLAWTAALTGPGSKSS